MAKDLAYGFKDDAVHVSRKLWLEALYYSGLDRIPLPSIFLHVFRYLGATSLACNL
jgi:hypothetical protein